MTLTNTLFYSQKQHIKYVYFYSGNSFMLQHSYISTAFLNINHVSMVKCWFINELATLMLHYVSLCGTVTQSSGTSSSFLTCADPSGTQLKLPKLEFHHESRTVPKFGLLPSSPTVLAGAQPGDRAQTKMTALHRNNTQSNYQTTQKLCIYTKILQTTSFRLNQLVSVQVKYALKKERKKLHSLLEMIKKKPNPTLELTTTENDALLCLYII